MIKPRAGLYAFLLAFAPAIWADTITVTTFADENNGLTGVGSGCSLREAVAYMSLTPTPARDEDGEFVLDADDLPAGPYREDGYGGCKLAEGVSEGGTDTIILPAQINKSSGIYELTLGQIHIKTSLSIEGDHQKWLKFPTIKATENARIFYIDDEFEPEPVVPPAVAVDKHLNRISISLMQLRLLGNGTVAASNKSGNGGLVYSEGEFLSLSKVHAISGKAANKGGAIYLGHASQLSVSDSEFNANKATTGAAIFMADDEVVQSTTTDPDTSEITHIYAKSYLGVSGSLFAAGQDPQYGANNATAGAIIDFSGNPDNETAPELYAGSGIASSTISGNAGYALKVAKGLVLQHVTIVGNNGGLDWGQSTGSDLLTVINSIIANNSGNDCHAATLTAVDPGSIDETVVKVPFVQYSLFGQASSAECQKLYPSTGASPFGNRFTVDSALMATAENCISRIGTASGLLCPLENNGHDIRTHRPRVLVSGADLVTDLASSNIIFRASNNACAADQRGQSPADGRCDIGALQVQSDLTYKPVIRSIKGGAAILSDIEVRDENDSITTAGYVSGLGDVDLLPADTAVCESLGVELNPATDELAAGCLVFRDGRLVTTDAPTKGYIERIAGTQELRYVPFKGFHGTDRFTFRVATTLSRFADVNLSSDAKFVSVSVRVDGSTEDAAKSKTTKLAGSVSLYALFGVAISLLLLGTRSRKINK